MLDDIKNDDTWSPFEVQDAFNPNSLKGYICNDSNNSLFIVLGNKTGNIIL